MDREEIKKVFGLLKKKIAEYESELHKEGLCVKKDSLEKRNGNIILRRKVGSFTKILC